MGRRPQPNDLRPQIDRAVIEVVGNVVQGGVDGHSDSRWASTGFLGLGLVTFTDDTALQQLLHITKQLLRHGFIGRNVDCKRTPSKRLSPDCEAELACADA